MNEVEKFTLEDGRKAEKSTTENIINEVEKEIVTEIRAEEARPLKTQKRIIEKVKPFIYERRIETIDPSNGEVLDVVVEEVVKATENNYTKEEVVEEILKALKEKKSKINSLGMVEKIEEKEEISLKDKFSFKDISLMAIIVAQILGLIYLLFWN